jgi:hypothetical protein
MRHNRDGLPDPHHPGEWIFEPTVQTSELQRMYVLILCAVILLAGTLKQVISPNQFWGTGFAVYYDAAGGIAPPVMVNDYWCFPDFVRFLWVPFTWFDFSAALAVWMVLIHWAWLVIVWKLTDFPYGKLLAVLLQFPANSMVQSGNVGPILLLASIYPVGAAVSAIIKPHAGLSWLVSAWFNADSESGSGLDSPPDRL